MRPELYRESHALLRASSTKDGDAVVSRAAMREVT
jgi:hypothetical protein